MKIGATNKSKMIQRNPCKQAALVKAVRDILNEKEPQDDPLRPKICNKCRQPMNKCWGHK